MRQSISFITLSIKLCKSTFAFLQMCSWVRAPQTSVIKTNLWKEENKSLQRERWFDVTQLFLQLLEVSTLPDKEQKTHFLLYFINGAEIPEHKNYIQLLHHRSPFKILCLFTTYSHCVTVVQSLCCFESCLRASRSVNLNLSRLSSWTLGDRRPLPRDLRLNLSDVIFWGFLSPWRGSLKSRGIAVFRTERAPRGKGLQTHAFSRVKGRSIPPGRLYSERLTVTWAWAVRMRTVRTSPEVRKPSHKVTWDISAERCRLSWREWTSRQDWEHWEENSLSSFGPAGKLKQLPKDEKTSFTVTSKDGDQELVPVGNC